MSRPTNTTTVSSKIGGDGRYTLDLSDVFVLRVTTTSSGASGDTAAYASYQIDWGDDTSSNTDFKVIGGQNQFQHSYDAEGSYQIVLTTTNMLGDTATDTFLTLVSRRNSVVTPVNTWVGISTPGQSFVSSLNNQSANYPPFSAKLSEPASESSDTVLYLSSGQTVQDGDALVITEVGKLLSYVSVSHADQGAVTIIGSLNDSYTTGALVEVQRSDTKRVTGTVTGTVNGWFFPVASGREMVKASLRTLLHTRLGERVMRPNVGNNLHLIPFEQNDLFSQDQAQVEVARVFASEPRSVLEGVSIAQTDNDMGVSVAASIVNEQASFVLEVAT